MKNDIEHGIEEKEKALQGLNEEMNKNTTHVNEIERLKNEIIEEGNQLNQLQTDKASVEEKLQTRIKEKLGYIETIKLLQTNIQELNDIGAKNKTDKRKIDKVQNQLKEAHLKIDELNRQNSKGFDQAMKMASTQRENEESIKDLKKSLSEKQSELSRLQPIMGERDRVEDTGGVQEAGGVHEAVHEPRQGGRDGMVNRFQMKNRETSKQKQEKMHH